MDPVARLREVGRLASPRIKVEDRLVVEARLLAGWLQARRRAERQPSEAHEAAAARAFNAYREHLLLRIPLPR